MLHRGCLLQKGAPVYLRSGGPGAGVRRSSGKQGHNNPGGSSSIRRDRGLSLIVCRVCNPYDRTYLYYNRNPVRLQ